MIRRVIEAYAGILPAVLRELQDAVRHEFTVARERAKPRKYRARYGVVRLGRFLRSEKRPDLVLEEEE